jgi:hypothetical protein
MSTPAWNRVAPWNGSLRQPKPEESGAVTGSGSAAAAEVDSEGMAALYPVVAGAASRAAAGGAADGDIGSTSFPAAS